MQINEHEFGNFLIESAETLGAFIDTLDGIDDDETKQAIEYELTKLSGEISQRVDVLNYMIKHDIEADISKLDNVIKACQDKKQVLKNRQSRLKDIVKMAIKTTGEKGNTFKAHIRSTESVEITDESLLPDAYKQKTISYTPKKKEIKQAIKDGKKVDGARIITKESVVIK